MEGGEVDFEADATVLFEKVNCAAGGQKAVFFANREDGPLVFWPAGFLDNLRQSKPRRPPKVEDMGTSGLCGMAEYAD